MADCYSEYHTFFMFWPQIHSSLSWLNAIINEHDDDDDDDDDYLILSFLHSLICRVLLLLLLRNASDLRNCTSYFGACMWVWYCRPPVGAHFHPTPQPPPVPQQLGGGRKMAAHYVARRVCAGAGDRR